MKSKIPSIIFRIIMVLTFICGVTMTVFMCKFIFSIGSNDDYKDMDQKLAGILGNFGLFFFAFFIMIGLCFILSIVCFKAHHPAISAIRTCFIGITLIINSFAVKMMLYFLGLREFVNDKNLDKLNEYLDDFSFTDNQTLIMFVPLISVIIFAILFITSIAALAQGPNIGKYNSDLDFKLEPELIAESEPEHTGPDIID